VSRTLSVNFMVLLVGIGSVYGLRCRDVACVSATLEHGFND
jgi:hypothetical protein